MVHLILCLLLLLLIPVLFVITPTHADNMKVSGLKFLKKVSYFNYAYEGLAENELGEEEEEEGEGGGGGGFVRGMVLMG